MSISAPLVNRPAVPRDGVASTVTDADLRYRDGLGFILNLFALIPVFGGVSKGERNRIKVRVRAAMTTQAQMEGRYLGGRPPYGFRRWLVKADGTPVRQLEDMGLGPDLEGFHRFDGLRSMAFGKTLELRWPAVEGMPDYGYVITRADRALRQAKVAGKNCVVVAAKQAAAV